MRKNPVLRSILIIIGALLVALALEMFFVPNRIIDGGITGISIMLSRITGFPLGVFLFVLNLPFLYVGYRNIGKSFAILTFLGITVMSIGTYWFGHLIPTVTYDSLLAAVFGGIVLGVGDGLVIRYGGSLDGTEVFSILVHKRVPFSIGEVIMILNVFILGTAGLVFSWDRAMYSLIAYFVAYKTIDITVEGLEQTKSVWIISDEHEAIGQAIMERLGRGVTYLRAEGAFSGEDKRMIFSVITRIEEAKLRSIVEELDEEAFLAIGNIADVRGGRVKRKNLP